MMPPCSHLDFYQQLNQVLRIFLNHNILVINSAQGSIQLPIYFIYLFKTNKVNAFEYGVRFQKILI